MVPRDSGLPLTGTTMEIQLCKHLQRRVQHTLSERP
jgi:hypothetical protein